MTPTGRRGAGQRPNESSHALYCAPLFCFAGAIVSTATSAAIAVVIAEILAGDALSLSGAGRLLPATRGQRLTTAPQTVWRWARFGARSPDGRMVRLEAARVAGRWLTSRAAVARFIMAMTEAEQFDEKSDAAKPMTESRRKRRSLSAAARLKSMGC